MATRAELGKERLARVPIDEDLRDAVKDYQRFTAHEAKRRQLQYIGKLMRNVDPEPIRAALDAFKGVSAVETAKMHRLENMRTLLLEDEIDISRGDMIVASGEAPAQSKQVEALVCWLSETPLSPARTYWLRHTTREVTAKAASTVLAGIWLFSSNSIKSTARTRWSGASCNDIDSFLLRKK